MVFNFSPTNVINSHYLQQEYFESSFDNVYFSCLYLIISSGPNTIHKIITKQNTEYPSERLELCSLLKMFMERDVLFNNENTLIICIVYT